MRKSYASDISREKFEEIRLLLQNVRRRTKPTTVDLYEVLRSAVPVAHRLPVEIFAQRVSEVAHGPLVLCQVE